MTKTKLALLPRIAAWVEGDTELLSTTRVQFEHNGDWVEYPLVNYLYYYQSAYAEENGKPGVHVEKQINNKGTYWELFIAIGRELDSPFPHKTITSEEYTNATECNRARFNWFLRLSQEALRTKAGKKAFPEAFIVEQELV